MSDKKIQKKNLEGLLGEFSIEIPALQRDYAQGRWAQKEIGKGFVNALIEALDDEKSKGLHLDFIYGYVEEEDSKKLILIDGQQRLTTLWLLHLYLYERAGKVDKKNWLGRFSYAARSGAQEFCKKLLALSFCASKKPSVVFDEAEKCNKVASNGDNSKEDDASDVAKNDPTIAAMLNMLDWIHEGARNKNPDELVNRLGGITFDFFDMKQFELGEELYIKMNARGKPLSEYENIKALIEKGVKDKGLLERIDAEWSDYFYSDDSNSGLKDRAKLFDARGKNFLYHSALFFGLEKYFDSKENKQEESKKLEDEAKGGANQARDIFKKIELKERAEFYKPLEDWENLKWLDRVMELFRRMHFESSLSELLGGERLEMLTNASFFDDMKHANKCYFVAILWYCKNPEIHNWEASKLLDYLKVVRHLVENHPTSNGDFYLLKFFKLFEGLSDGASDIYGFMAGMGESSIEELEIYKGAFVNKALRGIFALEVRKAILIAKSRSGGDDWERVLDRAERHVVLRGRVDFLLDFSDVDFDGEKWGDEVRYCNPRFEVFKRYATITMKLLDRDFLSKNLPLLQRAWLCIGDFGVPKTHWYCGHYSERIYGYTHDSFNDRDAWHHLLSGGGKKIFFKNLLDEFDESDDKESLYQKMNKFVESYTQGKDFKSRKWWEQLLIKQEGHFRFLLERSAIQFNQRPMLRKIDGKDEKVELLPKSYSTRIGYARAIDVLGYGFYLYCEEKKGWGGDARMEDEAPYRGEEIIHPCFKIDGKEVFCNSLKKSREYKDDKGKIEKERIVIGDKPYPISLDGENDIFAEFEKVLKGAKRCKRYGVTAK